MKARGLFIAGLLLGGLLAALHFELLNDFIATLPMNYQLMFIELNLSLDWHLGALLMMVVGLFSISIKKKEEF